MVSTALQMVKYYFPGVKLVVDADKDIIIEVSATDSHPEHKKDHASCAMAQACKRKFGLDGVLISRSSAYLIKGEIATRYLVPGSVSREIISFDRGAGFAPGFYQLKRITPSKKLGSDGRSRKGKSSGKKRRFRHVTTDVRTILGQ